MEMKAINSPLLPVLDSRDTLSWFGLPGDASTLSMGNALILSSLCFTKYEGLSGIEIRRN